MVWDWADRVSSVALQSLATQKYNKIDLLPVTGDLVCLNDYCKDTCSALVKELKEDSTKRTMTAWRQLAEVAMTWITLFNKRRGNEVAKMRVDTFTERPKWSESANEEIRSSFSKTEEYMLDR